jgi:hypothetical protein
MAISVGIDVPEKGGLDREGKQKVTTTVLTVPYCCTVLHNLEEPSIAPKCLSQSQACIPHS